MRALVPELPRGAWTLLAADVVSAVGSGMTLPFLLVYLHQVSGLGLGAAGLAVSAVALAGFVGNPVGGSLADRRGGRAALVTGLVFCAAGSIFFAFVSRPWQAFVTSATLGLGAAIVWPARTALLAIVVPPERRSGAYALQHATTNVGLGVGALLAALIVDASSPSAPALANDLSPDALRGRYNGVYTLAWTTGFAAGPALAGAALAAGAANALMLGLIGACAVGAAGSVRLAERLPPGIDVVDHDHAGAAVPQPAAA